MTNVIDADVLFAPNDMGLRHLPEGPIAYGNGFSWVGIQHGNESMHGSLNLFDLRARANRSINLPGRPGFAFPTTDPDWFIAGIEKHVQLFQVSTGRCETVSDEIDQEVENTLINDGIPFADGIVFGAKDLEFQAKKAGLYLWRLDQSLVRLRDDQICSNGKVILPDGDQWQMLDIDSPTQQVVRYRLDAINGTMSDAEVVLDLTGESIFPDGMVAAPDGKSVIIAFYNPNAAAYGVARQFDLESGSVICEWRTAAAPRVTCPLLMEVDDGVKLVLTTATEGMEDEMFSQHENSGCLFMGETEFESAKCDHRLDVLALVG